MIDRSALPDMPSVLRQLDVEPGRHRRSRCPIHRGDNPSAFAWTDDGLWFCHRCGEGGDVIQLIEKTLDTDFRGALRWLGIEPGELPKLDPAVTRQRLALDAVRGWCERTGRRLRDEHYQRFRIEAYGLEKLTQAPEDPLGWALLQVAYSGTPMEMLEDQLDAIDLVRSDEDRVETWRKYSDTVD